MNTLEKQAVLNKLASMQKAICYVLRQRLMSKQAEGGLNLTSQVNPYTTVSSPLNSQPVGQEIGYGALDDSLKAPFNPQRLQFQPQYSTPASRAQSPSPFDIKEPKPSPEQLEMMKILGGAHNARTPGLLQRANRYGM